MKKITFLILLMTSIGFAQQQTYNLDFEPGTPSGELDAWVSFDPPAPGLAIVTNPFPNGVNTSTTTQVMHLDMVQAAPCYAGATNLHGRLGKWELDSTVPNNLTLSMDVYRTSTAGVVGIKFANATNGTLFEIKDSQGQVTAANTWETLTWDISGFNVGDNVNIDQMVVFVDFTCGGPDRTQDIELYVDNITWGANKVADPTTCEDGIMSGDETGVDCGGTVSNCTACVTVTGPTDNPAAPPSRNAADVFSIYSDAYTNASVDNFDPNWGQSGHTQVNTAYDPGTGDVVLHYPNFNYQGTQISDPAVSTADLSAMEFVHIDVWTSNATALQFSPINDGGTGTGAGELLVNVPLVSGQWSSVDLPKSAFTGMTWDAIFQLKFDAQAGTTPADIWLENIYFYKGTPISTPTAPTDNPAAPPARAAADVFSIYGDAYTNASVDNFDPNWGQSGHTQVNTAYDPGTGDVVLHYPNFNYQGTQISDPAVSTADLSAMEFVHIDVWTANATALQFSPINDGGTGTGAGEFLVNVPLVSGQWSSVDLPKSAFTGMTWDAIFQLKFDAQAGTTPADIWLENIYFYKDAAASVDDNSASFTVYPNPATNKWIIQSDNLEINNVEIFDMLGKKVISMETNLTEVEVNASGLSNGLYIARIESANGVETIKLVKE